jgi:hypothetical protein
MTEKTNITKSLIDAGEVWPPTQSFYRPATQPRVARGTFVLALCGAAGAGKNTVADHLVATYGRLGGAKVPKNDGPMDLRQYALATELKLEVYNWLEAAEAMCAAGKKLNVPGGVWPSYKAGRSDAQKIEWINENKNHLRSVLQIWGTQYRRAQDDSYWVDRLLERIAEDSPQIAVITDVRFSNELAICHAAVKVEQIGQVEDPAVASHVSEREWRQYDFDCHVIRAKKGDLATLYRESERVFEYILERFHVQ